MRHRVQAEWNAFSAPPSPQGQRVWVVRAPNGRKLKQFAAWSDAMVYALNRSAR